MKKRAKGVRRVGKTKARKEGMTGSRGCNADSANGCALIRQMAVRHAVFQVVIFVKSVARAKMLNTLLNECNFPSVCIYGGMDQEERIKVRQGGPRRCGDGVESCRNGVNMGNDH